MIDEEFNRLRKEISEHESNRVQKSLGYEPLFAASTRSRIIIIGQAPGIKAQKSGIAWDDASGVRLMNWLGVSEEQFRDTSLFAHIPMDFYYPGKGKSGDLPPRKEFASLWHKRLIDSMPNVELILVIGRYAQKYYLPHTKGKTLTETVHNYQSYLPDYFPLVHPSPLNFRWLTKNTWFEEELVPVLQETVSKIVLYY
ncbi:MAG: uracil-DNA glycosylase family protein [Candidatus Saccharimonadales bacterium]